MEEAGGRKWKESRVKDRGSWRSNEMEERCESDRGGDEMYPATFGNEKKTGLKLDMMMVIEGKLHVFATVFNSTISIFRFLSSVGCEFRAGKIAIQMFFFIIVIVKRYSFL